MYQRFLVPIDGSDHSIHAVKTSITLIHNLKASVSVTLLHVNHTPPMMDNYDVTIDIEDEVEREGHEGVHSVAEKLRDAGIRCEVITRKGDPAHQICEIANNGHYDMVIMGSRGLGRVSELVLGSVSRHVVQHVNCPVIITK